MTSPFPSIKINQTIQISYPYNLENEELKKIAIEHYEKSTCCPRRLTEKKNKQNHRTTLC